MAKIHIFRKSEERRVRNFANCAEKHVFIDDNDYSNAYSQQTQITIQRDSATLQHRPTTESDDKGATSLI